jgi:L-alanine-DL-glutamate epimerase-like enolase superfamily enzyme
MTRIDVLRGGITGARKTAIVAEAYGIRCEIHMGGWANLQVLGATSEDTSEYYEKGLLAPGVNYDECPPFLRASCDVIDADGFVTLSEKPGIGYDIVWDYIDDNIIDPRTYNKEDWV